MPELLREAEDGTADGPRHGARGALGVTGDGEVEVEVGHRPAEQGVAQRPAHDPCRPDAGRGPAGGAQRRIRQQALGDLAHGAE